MTHVMQSKPLHSSVEGQPEPYAGRNTEGAPLSILQGGRQWRIVKPMASKLEGVKSWLGRDANGLIGYRNN